MGKRVNEILRLCILIALVGAGGCFADRSGLAGLEAPGPRGGCTPACENGGVCVGSDCFCAPVDFMGASCTERIDDCAGIDCLNGDCLDRVRAWSCNCHEGWAVDDDGLCSVQLVSCDTPNSCFNGTCDDSSGTVVCSCDPGFQGTNCNAPINCGSPPEAPAHAGTSSITGTEFGDVVMFACYLGFGAESATVTCQADGTWESLMLSCPPAECGSLEAIANGSVFAPDGTTYGATATYSCDVGYRLDGPADRTCGPDGNWSGEPRRCLMEGSCTSQPCAHGFCVDSGSNTFECVCLGGWTGYQCNVDIDECAGGLGPCNPVGTRACINEPGSYRCDCMGDWEGARCQEPD